MSILRHFKRLQFIDLLIRKRATGDPATFARKNGLSKRGLTKVLHEMKELGFPVKYSRENECYYYEEDGELVERLFIKKEDLLSRNEARQLSSADAYNLCFSKIKIFEICKESE